MTDEKQQRTTTQMQWSIAGVLSLWLIMPLLSSAASITVPTVSQVTQVRTRSAKVWIKNGADADQLSHYRLVVKNSHGSIVYAVNDTVNAAATYNVVRLHQLKPNHSYTLYVKAVTSRGSSRWNKLNLETDATSNDRKQWSLIDVEAHAAMSAFDGEALVQAMDDFSISRTILMPEPSPLEGYSAGSSSSTILEGITGYQDNFSVMYGGKELNGILNVLGDDFVLDEAVIMPNGSSQDLTEALETAQEILDAPSEWERRFVNRATEAAASGLYVAFGEIGPYHLSHQANHPYIRFPADSELMLELSDIAATYDMPIQLHLEATEESVQELEHLLEHNRNTKIVWTHPGWYHLDADITAQWYGDLLAAHPNLYLAIKMREPNRNSYDRYYPLNKNGSLRPQWKTLLTTYRNRIMIGNDTKQFSSSIPTEELIESYEPMQELIDALPKRTARAITSTTASRIFGL